MKVTLTETLELLLNDAAFLPIMIGLIILAVVGIIYGAILVYKGSHY